MITQESVREKLLDRVGRETQVSVAKNIGIPCQVISEFKKGKKDLWNDSLIALNTYLDEVKQADQAAGK